MLKIPSMETTVTYQYRIKDSSIKKTLIQMSSEVNFVWNFNNNIIRKRWKESRLYTDLPFLNPLNKGASKELSINSQTIQAVYQELLKKVKQHKKPIRFRSRKKKLGWVPFNGQTFKFLGNYSTYNGYKIRYWYHRPLPEGAVVKTGSFSEDALGRWYLNLVVTFPEYLEPALNESVGIDLGIKTTLTCSDGVKFERPSFTTKNAEALAKAQKYRKKQKVKRIHAKIKNQRKDWNHKTTFSLASTFRNVFVGNTPSEKILTEINNINKAVYDASWYEVKTLLSYKVLRRQGVFQEVSELYSTETCSVCLVKSGPSGVRSLKIREWTCSVCNSVHDRDINAALNHLRLGHESLRAA
jgi:transposase